MKKPERSSYTALDFLQWHEGGTLVITPKFQRRGVWSRAAQSYLIDTLLLGLPVPPIYLRVTQDTSKRSVVREVVDGQQRIGAVVSYLQDAYPLSKNIETPCVGKRFSQLSETQKNAISHYSFICEVFYGVEDGQILQIFARLNTNSVKLNSQELRNGKFFGKFKQSAYGLALEHLEFWRTRRIFTEQAIARMKEVELVSELLILFIDGLQDKKKSIDDFYERLDEDFPKRQEVQTRFRAVIDAINEAIGENLKQTEFKRAPLFYSLFAAVAHRMYRLPAAKLETPARGKLSRQDSAGLRDAVIALSDILAAAIEKDGVASKSYEAFVNACLRQTDNIRPRQIRLETIYKHSFS